MPLYLRNFLVTAVRSGRVTAIPEHSEPGTRPSGGRNFRKADHPPGMRSVGLQFFRLLSYMQNADYEPGRSDVGDWGDWWSGLRRWHAL